MSNALAHSHGAAAFVGWMHAVHDLHVKGELTAAPVFSAAIASLLGSLPDLIEPASHPNHRQFFHSAVFAAALIYGLVRLYEWKPRDSIYQITRGALLIAGLAYLAHVAMDARTTKSIPWVGKL